MTKEQKEEFLQYLENLKLIQADNFYREGLDMAISAISEELSEDGTLTVHVSDGSKVKRVFVMGDNIFGGLYYPDSAENKGDLISRQAVLDQLEKWDWQDLYLTSHFKQILDDVPPVKNKGEWERVCGGSLIDEYRCSKCKHLPPKKPLPDIKTWGWDFTNFCPNCGADMREPKGEKGTK